MLFDAEIQPEVAKGCDLWSIFDLLGFLPEEAYAAYQEAAQHDISFSFPVTLKDSNNSNAVYNLLFRCACTTCLPQRCIRRQVWMSGNIICLS